MNKKQALELLHKYMQNQNLRRHCYAVGAVMSSLYDRLNSEKKDDERERWMIAGILHDVDYEVTKNSAKTDHTIKALEWLQDLDVHTDIRDAIAAHAWGFLVSAPQPKTPMQWALYCCDELTGLIVATALVKPDKTLASVTVDSVLKKWNSPSFAAGVDRKQIENCQSMLGIQLAEFIDIALKAMQNIHGDLGL